MAFRRSTLMFTQLFLAKEKRVYTVLLCAIFSTTLIVQFGFSRLALGDTPTISYINPSKVSIGHPDFTLSVSGTNFDNDTVIRWNGNDQATQFVSSSKLTASIAASELTTSGTALLTVFNPGTGTESLAKSFTIDKSHNLRVVGHLKSGWEARKIRVVGTHAYIAAGMGGLRVLDVSDPANPVEIGFLITPDEANDLKVVGNSAYIAAAMEHLLVVNITNPVSPTLAGSFKHTGGYVNTVDVAGDRVYLGQEYSGLMIVNVSDLAHITFLAQFDTPAIVQGVLVDGNYVYLSDYKDYFPNPPIEGGLRVVDVSDPSRPSLAKYAPLFSYPSRLIKKQDYLYVADLLKGLSIVDVSDPLNPVESATLANSVSDMVTYNGQLITSSFSGIHLYELISPIILRNVGYYKTAGDGRGIEVKDGFIYVADGKEGIKILQSLESLFLPLIIRP